ncbi:hypothetical protein [uncultured Desulfovibrio sp.]|uniref:hypothetical protein n=1 Tax=uncultured Desulfovibrio sp. TaxID=167968 RepID=UPI002625C45D|nr:hypothetical protein [uncultured Desulfovibrio sp.]
MADVSVCRQTISKERASVNENENNFHILEEALPSSRKKPDAACQIIKHSINYLNWLKKVKLSPAVFRLKAAGVCVSRQ